MSSSGAASAASVLKFFNTIERLKTTKRTGWLDNKVPGAESISDHMYRMSIMAMIIDDKTLDMTRCVKMALCHDLAECIVGDITPHAPISKEEKFDMEKAGFKHLCELLGDSDQAKEMYSLWEEYEECATPEALLVKDLDKFEMIVQALEYERRGRPGDEHGGRFLQSFFDSTRGKYTHPKIKEWVAELERTRNTEFPPT